MKKILALLFSTFTLASFSQSLPADRPGQTMNATTVQAGVWQIQTGADVGGYINNKNGKSFDSWGFPVDIRYGIFDKLEVMINGTASFAATQGTGSGIEYGLLSYAGYLRYNLFDETNFGSMALFGGYQHQSYEGGIAAANNFIAKLLYKLPLGEKLQFATNLGYVNSSTDKLDNSNETGNSFEYTAAFSYNINTEFGLFLETYGSQGNGSSAWIDGGVYWLPNPAVQWDFVLGNGGSGDFSQYFATIGVCFHLGEPR